MMQRSLYQVIRTQHQSVYQRKQGRVRLSGDRWLRRPPSSLFSMQSSSSLCSASLAQQQRLVCSLAGKYLFLAVRPQNQNAVELLDWTEAEMGARVIAGKVAGGRVDPPLPAFAARLQRDLGAISIPAAECWVDSAHQQPMTS